MRLFRKRAEHSAGRDAALTFMSSRDAQEVRALVRNVFAELGLEVDVLADHVRDSAGRQFGLWNVAAACHNDERGRSAWPTVVREHVHRVVASLDRPSPFDELMPDEAAGRTYARLYDTAGMPDLATFPHREFAPGLVEMLALDLPDTVAVYPQEAVQRLGGWESLRGHGLNNLRLERVDELEKIETRGKGAFQLLMGESVYTASRALLMPGLASELTGEEPTDYGWLLSVPNRHQLIWHLIRDIAVVPTVEGMAHFACLGYGDAPGALSPHVYWWDGAQYHQLTRIDEAGNVAVHVNEPFQDVLETLARSS